MTKVSIIIVNYNTFELTSKCIESVYTFTKLVDFEVIVVDNASIDSDPNEFLVQFPKIKLVKSDENVGFAKGNNLGISQAKGEVILLLNSDTELTDDSISIAYQDLQTKSKCGVVTGKLMYPDGRIQHNCQAFPSIGKQILERTRFHKFLSSTQKSKRLQGFYFDYSKSGNPDWVWGTFFMFRKSLLNEFPFTKLPETYFMYMEDMEWCMEIRKRGYTIHYNPTISVIHHMGGSSGNSSKLIQIHYLDFIQRYYPSLTYVVLKKLYR